MSTDQLLDLFAVSPTDAPGSGGQGGGDGDAAADAEAAAAAGGGSSLKQILNGIGDLWDEEEYKEQFDVSSFISNLDP